MGVGVCPAICRHAITAVLGSMPYIAVGMHKAVDSAMGLPSMSTSAARMLWLLTPPEVRSSFMTRLPRGLTSRRPPRRQRRRPAPLAASKVVTRRYRSSLPLGRGG
jgi:hypothetical protein